MLVETVHVRPSRSKRDWQELRDALKAASMVAVLVDGTVDWTTLMAVARVIALSDARVVAGYGERSEELHDLVDLIARSERELGPITTFENGSLDVFISNITFTYRGLLDINDQDRKTLICYVSESESIPPHLELTIDAMRRRHL